MGRWPLKGRYEDLKERCEGTQKSQQDKKLWLFGQRLTDSAPRLILDTDSVICVLVLFPKSRKSSFTFLLTSLETNGDSKGESCPKPHSSLPTELRLELGLLTPCFL
jgi:hypothetical protein